MRHFKFNNLLRIQYFLCVKRKIWLKLAVSLSEHCEELWIRKFRGGACCQPDELLKANPFSSAVISFWKRPFAVVALIAGICLLDLYDTARPMRTYCSHVNGCDMVFKGFFSLFGHTTSWYISNQKGDIEQYFMLFIM